MIEPDEMLEMQYEERVAPTLDDGPDYHADDPGDAHCIVCGDLVDYCSGHGETGDPAGFAILQQHDMDDHSHCHPNGCEEANDALQ